MMALKGSPFQKNHITHTVSLTETLTTQREGLTYPIETPIEVP